MTTHLMHLFDPAVRGLKGEPTRPVRLAPTTQNDVFLNALLETGMTKTMRRSPLEWAAATAMHIAIIATLIIVPLYTTETIQLRNYEDIPLVAPPAPPPPPPAAGRTVAPHVTSKRPSLTYTLGKLTAPTSIPKTVSLGNAAPAPDLDGLEGGVPSGVPGGQLGGSLGGVLGGAGTSTPIPPPPPRHAARRIVRVGSNLKAPQQTYSVQPNYPTLARQERIWGDVVVDAVIDEQGNVVQAHVVSGHPLLITAALNAVLQWKYQPTLLNGTPVAVEMEVTVHFILGNQ
jgi:periplasmic protein TonB